MKLFELFATLGLETKDFDNKVDGATQKGKGLANNLGSAVSTAGKAIAGITVATATAVTALTTATVKGFADYEQLVGGVETLFKDSSGLVKGYAENAYKTAGLSANQYMETVTSFSASLLQSLNGDTAKSAKVADMAITDMSDNANKMGTSMESIQFAYQGFAKQNYTMLDNLKLGYGGTKEEMQRLLADAEKLSGTKYDISNLNDVYQAIHVVQTELGITGTTAKEASETISGSFNMTKSAFKNLLTGLANGNADVKKLIKEFTDSAKTLATNLMPAIKTTLENIPVLFKAIIPEISKELPSFFKLGFETVVQLVQGIVQELPVLLQEFMNIVPSLVQTISDTIPSLLQSGIDIILALATSITDSLPLLIPVVVNLILSIIDTIINNLDKIIAVGLDLILALATGLLDANTYLIEKLPQIIDAIVKKLTDQETITKIFDVGFTLIIKLAQALLRNIPILISSAGKIALSIISGLIDAIFSLAGWLIGKIGEFFGNIPKWIGNAIGDMGEVGKNIVRGLWEGIKSLGSWITEKVGGFFGGIGDFVKGVFGIASPSKLFKYYGKMIDEGFVKGIEGDADKVQRSVDDTFSDLYNQDGINSSLFQGAGNSIVINVNGTSNPHEVAQEVNRLLGGYI